MHSGAQARWVDPKPAMVWGLALEQKCGLWGDAKVNEDQQVFSACEECLLTDRMRQSAQSLHRNRSLCGLYLIDHSFKSSIQYSITAEIQ